MPNMTSYDQGDVVLATLPFSDLLKLEQAPRLGSAFRIRSIRVPYSLLSSPT